MGPPWHLPSGEVQGRGRVEAGGDGVAPPQRGRGGGLDDAGPATGAAAAAFGGYLRSLVLVAPPARITVHQGADMGRPSRLLVDVPPGEAGVSVGGTAAPLG
ncbi:hypothetical protein GWI34_21845 [Actinomadura sp. DSM 109109]|nr:hypothetical protein [Actinomadura lepetitiana]